MKISKGSLESSHQNGEEFELSEMLRKQDVHEIVNSKKIRQLLIDYHDSCFQCRTAIHFQVGSTVAMKTK